MLPFPDRVAVAYSEISTGAVARYLCLLAETLGRRDDAERHFEDALELNERIGARSWLARTQLDYAGMLLGRDERGDAARAVELLEGCLETADEIGMRPVGERASALRADASAAARR